MQSEKVDGTIDIEEKEVVCGDRRIAMKSAGWRASRISRIPLSEHEANERQGAHQIDY